MGLYQWPHAIGGPFRFVTMTSLPPDFLIIPYEVLSDPKLQALDKFLYGVVYWYEYLRLKKCTASNPELARVLQTTPLVVANSLNSGH